MKPVAEQPALLVGMISLGCAKNLVDAEVMLGTLLRDGAQITNDATEADALIINTCSFIDSAQEESVDAILESAEVRQARRPGQALIVAGCLTQRFRDQLPKLLPEVDAFMGIDQVTDVTAIVRDALKRRRAKVHPPSPRLRRTSSPQSKVGSARGEGRGASGEVGGPKSTNPLIHQSTHPSSTNPPSIIPHPSPFHVSPRPRYIPDYATPRFRLTPGHFAYLKIAEGCNHPCSFCTIPQMRGAHRSRPQDDVVTEAAALLAQGVKELNLISQDSTYYGLDLRPNRVGAISAPDRFNSAVKSLPAQAPTICTLLRKLNELPGDFWIRLLYTHPAHWTDELIRTIAESPKVARYVDIPLQHIHQTMLEKMRRETSQQYILDLLERIRAGIPGIALRTTFIVGFPGETEAQFEVLLEFIRSARFERLGVFTYSREESTRAGRMAGQVAEKVRCRRRDLAMAAQREVAVQVARSFVGRSLKVLVEKEAGATDLKQARVSSWEHGLIRTEGSTPADSAMASETPALVGGRGSSRSNEAQLFLVPGLPGLNRDSSRRLLQPPRASSALTGPYLVARGEADAPDIDGRVYLRGQAPLGQFAHVKVTGHTDYDLVAEIRA